MCLLARVEPLFPPGRGVEASVVKVAHAQVELAALLARGRRLARLDGAKLPHRTHQPLAVAAIEHLVGGWSDGPERLRLVQTEWRRPRDVGR